MADALSWFPLIGCLLAIVLFVFARAFSLASGGWVEGAAVILMAGNVFLTRGLHLDGLADCADGFGGGRSRADTLAIMKESQVGVFGLLAVLTALLIQFVAMLRLLSLGFIYWIIPVYIVSRTAMVELAVTMPYAGLTEGNAHPFVGGARFLHRIIALSLGILLIVAFGGFAGLGLLASGLIACRFLRVWFLRRIGGVTGDLLGACCVIIETLLLFSCAAAGQWLEHLAQGKILTI
jgi:adenosylcobinamide-GDP ribazoletransferase